MKYSTLIFDLDGTLLDTLGDLTDGVNHVLSRFCFKHRTEEEVRSFIGNGVPTLLRRALPENCCEKTYADAIKLFGDYYKTNMMNRTEPYTGMRELLLHLAENGAAIGVASNKKDAAVKELCGHYFGEVFYGERLKAALGTTTEDTRKPSPFLLREAMRILGSDISRSVFIGDSDVDIETARNAGMDVICVGWGYRSPDFLKSKGAERIALTTDELLILLTKGAKGV